MGVRQISLLHLGAFTVGPGGLSQARSKFGPRRRPRKPHFRANLEEVPEITPNGPPKNS